MIAVGRRAGSSEQLAGGLEALFDRARTGDASGRVGEDLARTGEPLARGVGGARLQEFGRDRPPGAPDVERQRHDRHIGVAELSQVVGTAARGLAVVDRDLGDVLAGRTLDGDGGDAPAPQRLDRDAEARAAADEHDRVDGSALDADGVAALLTRVGEEQESGAERRDALGDAVEHLDLHGVEERGADALLEHDADDARATAAERARRAGRDRRSRARSRRRARVPSWHPTPDLSR